jgi:hypothetical protein
MNPKPLLGSVWVFDDEPNSIHFLLLAEKPAYYESDEWVFETLEIETGKRQTGYFNKKSRNYGGWKEDK